MATTTGGVNFDVEVVSTTTTTEEVELIVTVEDILKMFSDRSIATENSAITIDYYKNGGAKVRLIAGLPESGNVFSITSKVVSIT